MSNLIEGDYVAKPTSAEFGVNKKGAPELRISFEIVEGPKAGRKVDYSGLFGEKSAKYTKQAMLALGWQGKDATTAVEDIMKSPKMVPIEVQIARWENPDTGKVSEWSAVRNVGRYKEPLKALDKKGVSEVNEWLAQAGGDSEIPF